MKRIILGIIIGLAIAVAPSLMAQPSVEKQGKFGKATTVEVAQAPAWWEVWR